MKRIVLSLTVLVLSLTITSCGGGSSTTTDTDTFTLTSSDFTNGGVIPLAHACTGLGGGNQSPELTWTNLPASTDTFALIVDDEVSPCGTGDNACKHWSVYNISSLITSFGTDENVTLLGSGITEGENYMMTNGYEGPCPPSQHTYKFTIYALKTGMSGIAAGTALTRSEFQAAYSSFILDSATLQGTYTP